MNKIMNQELTKTGRNRPFLLGVSSTAALGCGRALASYRARIAVAGER